MMKRLLLCFLMLMPLLAAQAQTVRIEVPAGDSPAMGPADAPVTIIEFIDFQ